MGVLALVFSCKKNVVHGTGSIYSDPKSLFSEINANFNLSHYDTALLVSGLDSVLAGKGPFTAFVVQDDAYPTIGTNLSGGITYYTGGSFYGRDYSGAANFYYQYVQQGDLNYLKRVAGYHILPLNLKIADIPFALNTGYPTLAGDSIYISKYIDPNSIIPDTVVTVNGIRVTRSDFGASNGTYHVLKQLLFPAPNRSILDILSGSNAPGWAFEPKHNETNPYTPPVTDTLGFALPPYNYGLFTTALVRTGLDQLLKGPGPYTVLAVPDQNFVSPYVTSAVTLTLQQIDNMNIDTLTRLMKLHILKGRYFLSDFLSAPYNGNNLDTVYNPAFGMYSYSAPLAFPTLGGDTLYVIPNGKQLNGSSGFWMFGRGNLLYSPYTSLYQNAFAGAGLQDYLNYTLAGGYSQAYLPQDVVAPNGVIQFLYFNELVFQ
jgi:uncharacterized surface protein with fasciclin (FAS1) repeats